MSTAIRRPTLQFTREVSVTLLVGLLGAVVIVAAAHI